jgi:hypothetical protein
MDKAPGEIRGTSPLRYYLRILQSQADAPLNHRGTSGFSSEVKARRSARQAEKLVLMSDGYPDRDLRVVAGSILKFLQGMYPRPLKTEVKNGLAQLSELFCSYFIKKFFVCRYKRPLPFFVFNLKNLCAWYYDERETCTPRTQCFWGWD